MAVCCCWYHPTIEDTPFLPQGALSWDWKPSFVKSSEGLHVRIGDKKQQRTELTRSSFLGRDSQDSGSKIYPILSEQLVLVVGVGVGGVACFYCASGQISQRTERCAPTKSARNTRNVVLPTTAVPLLLSVHCHLMLSVLASCRAARLNLGGQ